MMRYLHTYLEMGRLELWATSWLKKGRLIGVARSGRGGGKPLSRSGTELDNNK